jgi:hypothetical protein
MNTQFKEIFGEIEDPRVDRTKLHSLLDVIALGILGVMAGAQGFEEMGLLRALILENFKSTCELASRN